MSIKGFSVGGNVERYDYNSLDNLPSEITIDTALSDSSTNPVQNRVVTSAINSANGSISSISGEVDDLKSATDELSAEKISKEKIGGIWKEFVFPSAFLGTFKPVKLFTDGKFWKTDFNKEDWKVTASGAKTYYVDPSGTYLNDGLSPDKPVPMYNAISRSSAGDTIIVADGDYRIDNVTNAVIPSITKSLNIIGKGNVRFSKSSKKTPTFDSGTGLYTITQAAMQGAYDPDLDIYYTVADTLADCQATVNSVYFGAAPTVYVNMTYQHDIFGVYNDVMFVVDNSAADVQVYVENIEFMGGGCCFQTTTTNAHSCLVVFDNCKFTYNVGGSNNVVKIASAQAIFNKCVARYSRNDGFAYTVTENGANTGFVEIDCEAYNNGFNLSSDSSNGSTAHSGICGIRVNGIYHGSKGGNVADVQTGTQTINCGCSAFNSVAAQDGYNEGFGIQQAGATQWLYNCVAFGNFYDFYGVPSSEQIAFRSSHIKDNYSFDYSGTLTDTQPKTLAEINFENSAKISQQL